MTKQVPAERRRSVVVMTSSDLRAARRDNELVNLLDDPEVAFIGIDTASTDADPLAELLRAQDLLRPGTVAVQSPYDADRYVTADVALVELAVEKFLLLTHLAQTLGASEVKFTDVRAELRSVASSGRVEIKSPASTTNSEGAREVESQVSQKLVGVHRFDGGDPDIAAATDLLRSSRLMGDPQLRNLIRLRDSSNPVRSQTLIISGTREAAGNMTAALRVAGGPVRLRLAGFSTDLASKWSSKIDVEVTTEINF